MDLIDKYRFAAMERAAIKAQQKRIEERERHHPTICNNEGGCDWGLAFSQD
jgi:hypothetical protein